MTYSEFVQALDGFLYSYKDWGVKSTWEYEIDGNTLFINLNINNLKEDHEKNS